MVSQESIAAWHVRNQGFEAYLPRYKTYVVDRGRRRDLVRPVFPGYLFVYIDGGRWWSLRGTRGVIEVIMAGDTPAIVPSEPRPGRPYEMSMRYLFERFDEAGTRKLDDGRFHQGQKIRVLSGMWRDHVGLFDSMLPGDRVRVLFEMMGRSVATELGERELTAA
jgi:transcriptional antiterminator RfaH